MLHQYLHFAQFPLQHANDNDSDNDVIITITIIITFGITAPDIEEYLRWINDAWNALPDEAISKSFKSCGITNAVDGSEDEKIVCFRQAAPMGFEKLRSARQEPDIEMIFAEEEDTDENIINGIDDMEIV
ncbi:hypothetical protein DdX_18767 [Ditylenchus destructor]|uniref:DDE-1 domain-containing protein n=1 Tax=Ditylenchus destructor TaxID=166010 RepID=A0AAD4QSN4_9BILA|nr:hypothetical protein DdX_18767 [Ditylenchus destructor]